MNIPTGFFDRNYRYILAALLVLGLGTFLVINAVNPSPPKVNYDTSFYQHAGWYIAYQGAVPYVEIWSVKPPMHFIQQAVLALFSGGDMLILHWLNILLCGAAATGAVYFTTEFVIELTGDRLAGLAAGLGLLSLPQFYIYATMGFRSKIYVICFGMLSLLMLARGWSFWGGALGTIALGYWQFGIVFPVMCLLFSMRGDNSSQWRRTLIGILTSGLLILVPVFWWGALESMIVEAVAVPLIMDESVDLLNRVTTLIIQPNYTFGPLFLGFVGCFVYLWRTTFRGSLWFIIGFSLALIQVLLVDLDGVIDTFLLLGFVSIGAGHLVHLLSERHAAIGVILMIVLLVANGASMIHRFQNIRYEFPDRLRVRSSVQKKLGDADITIVKWRPEDFWNKRIPDSCHYRMSADELNWVNRTRQKIGPERCGKLSTVTKYIFAATRKRG